MREGDFGICIHSHRTANNMVGESGVLFKLLHMEAPNATSGTASLVGTAHTLTLAVMAAWTSAEFTGFLFSLSILAGIC